MNSDRLSTVWTPSAVGLLSILRIFTGLNLLQHGTGKVLGFPAVPMFANVQIDSLMGVGGLIELAGGILFTVGLFTRPVAFILSGFTAAGDFIAQDGEGFFPLLNRGRADRAFLLSVLFFFFV